MWPRLLDRGAQRRARAEQMRLPDELGEAARAHPHRQRTRVVVPSTLAATTTFGHIRGCIFSQIVVGIAIEKGIHLGEYRSRTIRPARRGAQGYPRHPSNV